MSKWDAPCAGCGKVLAGNARSLPAGERKCHDCRRTSGRYAIRACVTCGVDFKPGRGSPDQRACSTACRESAKSPCDDCGQLTTRGCNQAGRFCAACSEKRARERDARKDHGWTKSALLPSVRELAARDDYVCHVCREQVDMSLPFNDRMAPTRDHIVPRHHGGGHDPLNLKLAHRGCNSRRGAPLSV